MPTNQPTFRNLARYYGVALCAIATVIVISQVLVQQFIRDQENDSRMVNLSGRQRMLSQQITKCALLLGTSTAPEKRQKYLGELEVALREWTQAYQGLQQGDEMLGLQGQNSKKVEKLFSQVYLPYLQIKSATEGMIQKLHQDIHLPAADMTEDIQIITSYEGDFLREMDKIVFQYDLEANTRVSNLQNIGVFLTVICLGVILFEIFFVFFPSVRSIQHTIRKLSESREKSKSMALELGALYSSLEQAYQDLLEVDVVVEDNTVYAKCDENGGILHISERFAEVMEFKDQQPENVFDWLIEQGYDPEYLESIQEMVSTGKSWSGDIKAISRGGDFVWLKLNIVPTMNESGQMEALMIIGANETEKKEAEAISREINKEKIEKKVKEQQFRSALILEGQEEERKRISRDMHDGVGQLLSAMKFNLEGIHTVSADHEREKLEASKDLLKNVIREVRRISFNLTPSALSDYGIVPVLKKFSREITKISDLQVRFENKTGFLSRLEPNVENNLYRIVQEAVNNAIKYAQATEVKIILTHNSQFLYLEITDDGRGFNIEELEEREHFGASGHGIFNIRERTNFINGHCEITSESGKGTTISIQVSLE